MAWRPVAGLIPQYSKPDNTLASGHYLQFEQSGTSTSINMATDDTGGTEIARVLLNSAGKPEVSGAEFIPHLEEKYKATFYPTEADAIAKTNPVGDPIDAINPIGLVSAASSDITYTRTGTGAVATNAAAIFDIIPILTQPMFGSTITDVEIQAAIDAQFAIAPRQVFMSSALALVTATITVPAGIVLQGYGWEGTELRGTVAGPVVDIDNAALISGAGIQDIHVSQSTDNQPCVKLDSPRNCYVRRNRFAASGNFGLGGTCLLIEANHSGVAFFVWIADNYLTGGGQGVVIEGSPNNITTIMAENNVVTGKQLSTTSLSFSRSGTVLTVTWVANELSTNDYVSLSSVSASEFDGAFIVASKPTADTFTVAVANSGATSGSDMSVAAVQGGSRGWDFQDGTGNGSKVSGGDIEGWDTGARIDGDGVEFHGNRWESNFNRHGVIESGRTQSKLLDPSATSGATVTDTDFVDSSGVKTNRIVTDTQLSAPGVDPHFGHRRDSGFDNGKFSHEIRSIALSNTAGHYAKVGQINISSTNGRAHCEGRISISRSGVTPHDFMSFTFGAAVNGTITSTNPTITLKTTPNQTSGTLQLAAVATSDQSAAIQVVELWVKVGAASGTLIYDIQEEITSNTNNFVGVTTASTQASLPAAGTSQAAAINQDNTIYLALFERTVAQLATYAASDHDNEAIIISDETGGRTIATSDNTNWRRVSDGAIVS